MKTIFKMSEKALLMLALSVCIVSCGGRDDEEDTQKPPVFNFETDPDNGQGGGDNNDNYWDDNLNPSAKNNYPYAVDMGLSVKWSNKNLGTSKDFEPGGSYGWADSSGCIFIENLAYYPYGNLPKHISGTQYDVAKHNWGSPWRLPTKVEFEELINNSKIEWVKDAEAGGKMLLKFTSKKTGNYIFFSPSNIRYGKEIYNDGREGGYWTGDLTSDSNCAWTFAFYGDAEVKLYETHSRYLGLSVRPVYDN